MIRANGLQATVDKLETALTKSRATTKRIARQARADARKHNTQNAERERTLAGLRHAEAGYLRQIDDASLELAASTDRMRELSTALALAHEEEQRRIARELHDQIGQDLTALKITLSRGKKGSREDLLSAIQEAASLTDEILQTVRNICGTLRPQVLDDLGLVAGIQWHIKTFAARSRLDISFDLGSPVDESRLSPIVKITVFRVIQEALTNVSRHARAKTASVMLGMRNGCVEFSVRDGGKGFDVTGQGKEPSTGISSMRERVSLVQGKFEIASSPGQGTLIYARIPALIQNHQEPPTNRIREHGKGTTNQDSAGRRSSSGPQGSEIIARQ